MVLCFMVFLNIFKMYFFIFDKKVYLEVVWAYTVTIVF